MRMIRLMLVKHLNMGRPELDCAARSICSWIRREYLQYKRWAWRIMLERDKQRLITCFRCDDRILIDFLQRCNGQGLLFVYLIGGFMKFCLQKNAIWLK